MKKIALSFIVMFLPLFLGAQPGRPRPEELSDEEFVQMQTRDMANWLNLEGDARKKFISTYGAFRKEINSIAEKSRPADRAETEEEIDMSMQKNFEVSEKILDIRKRYYAEFKEFLKPSQIRQMYQFENEAGRRMHDAPGHPEHPGRPGGPGPDRNRR